jgi:AraC-like DNA-binding protein
MALIAALLPNRSDREALEAAAPDHRVAWANSWRDLQDVVKREPVAAAIADLHAERGKDGVLRIYRFAQKFPRTPILVWGDLDGRDLFRLGKAGATEIVCSPDALNAPFLSELIGDATTDSVAGRVDQALSRHLGDEALGLVQAAALRIPDGVQVPDLAAAYDMSVSTLERRCEQWGLTTPGRILLWLRILYGIHWLLEPGRSVESVGGQLGYSSGAAFRRAIKATLGGNPTPMRNSAGFDAALTAFVQDCPGAPAATASAVGV